MSYLLKHKNEAEMLALSVFLFSGNEACISNSKETCHRDALSPWTSAMFELHLANQKACGVICISQMTLRLQYLNALQWYRDVVTSPHRMELWEISVTFKTLKEMAIRIWIWSTSGSCTVGCTVITTRMPVAVAFESIWVGDSHELLDTRSILSLNLRSNFVLAAEVPPRLCGDVIT